MTVNETVSSWYSIKAFEAKASRFGSYAFWGWLGNAALVRHIRNFR